MVDAVKLRYALVPYIYNASRRNFDTGIAMCHPLYYDWPEDDRAYSYRQEYMFGDDILATCIPTPAEPVTALADVKMWFPEGCDWFDMATGAMHRGGEEKSLSYTISENPWYVKAGSIIPMNPKGVKSLKRQCDTLVLCFAPGASGELDYYEDDGISQQYRNGAFAHTKVTQIRSGNYIMEDPQGIFRYVDDLYSNKAAFDTYLDTETLIDDNLKARLRAQLGIERVSH